MIVARGRRSSAGAPTGTGRLGDGTDTGSTEHVGYRGITAATAIAAGPAGSQHTCALVADGAVQCWGDNGYGQLGDGTNTNSTIPVFVVGLS